VGQKARQKRETVAKTVFTGWRKVTPGKCSECGFDNDWGCDGSGHVLCSCSPDFDESYDTTEAGEAPTEGTGRVMGWSPGRPPLLAPVAERIVAVINNARTRKDSE
jgi:hypothetical protein